MAQSLTLVLPVHNAEATLPRQVEELLTMAGELTSRFELLVIDDGSIDDTYEIASELATRFPQIRVTRHADHRGFGPTLRALRGQVKSDVVIVHDGTSQLDAEQVRRLWAEKTGQQFRVDDRPGSGAYETYSADLCAPSRVHPAMGAAHRRLGPLELLPDGVSSRISPALAAASETYPSSPTAPRDQRGIGAIPVLPPASFFNSLTEFALGE
ncbi:MAG: glycosyltransferase [Pirellulales bacterium]